ncbi:hypothetical protein LguiB_003156 [Lonicera macranthoides]
MKSKTDTSENRFLGSISASSIRNFLPRSVSYKHKSNSIRTKSTSDCENIPPANPNVQILPSNPKQSPSKTPISNVQKRDTTLEVQKEVPEPSDPSTKVVIRIRPSNDRGQTVRKVSDQLLTLGDRQFKFDSVLDSNSKQEDVFQLVGVPLVKSALAGYNTSILAYGQTGSGKTYTMWGPPSAMLEGNSASSHQGIVPRIFEMLFSEIKKDQENSEGQQINYQCRCSFLEIYNKQIGDLLDPTQRNLEIKDDAKNGFYVENLTEEYVTNYEDVTHILIKGLSSRKVGVTSVNSKSSRSHIVFTCIIESWRKDNSSKCFGSSKTSRISLIDLAGFEGNRSDDASRQCVKEGKYVKKSLSQLGHLVNVLAERTRSGKLDSIPYKSSCLTHLLKESIGGNSKLTVLCAISPDNKCNGETMSTLRFGQQAKSIQNEPVINEITEDDVNDLSDRIRQLKEELIKAKSNECNSIGSNHGNCSGRSMRESLNQLRVSLNRSLILPRIDSEFKKEVQIDEDDVRALRLHIDNLHSSCEETDMSEQYTSCPEESENEEIYLEELPHKENVDLEKFHSTSRSIENAFRSSISINACLQSTVLQDPPLSESPKIGNTQRKSIVFPSIPTACPENVLESSRLGSDVLRQSQKRIDRTRSSLHSSKVFSGPTESLAASLQRGLEIIDCHQRNSASHTSVAFSFEHLALNLCDKVNASVQTLPEERQSTDASSGSFLCVSCRRRELATSNDIQDSLKTWIDLGKDLAEAIKREEELEKVCKEQAAKIEQLNHVLEQYKHETEEDINAGHKLLSWNDSKNPEPEIIIKEVSEELDHESRTMSFDVNEKETLLKEIESLKSKLQQTSNAAPNRSAGALRSSLLAQSIQLRKSGTFTRINSEEEFEKERERWMEMESDWICLTDELRIDIESNRTRAEKVEMELRLEKKCTEELDDALRRAMLGHARMIEHYTELQEKYNDLVGKHRLLMEGVEEVKMAAVKAAAKGHGSRFAKCLAAELSGLRVHRERERELLRKENTSLKIQLRDTAEAVHAAGELLVRLRESEEATSVAEENFTKAQEENDKLKKQLEKLKRKHKMEMITMKQYLAESRLPEAALRPPYRQESETVAAQYDTTLLQDDDDQAWRAEFGAIYQEHY